MLHRLISHRTAFFAAGLAALWGDGAFLRATLDFRVLLGLPSGSGLRAAQIRVTARSRDSNFLAAFTPDSPF